MSGLRKYLFVVIVLGSAVNGFAGTITVTCDNEYDLYVNGSYIGSDQSWPDPETWNIDFVSGPNVVAIHGRNWEPGPGLDQGLIVRIETDEGTVYMTDASWRATTDAVSGWLEPAFDDSGWPSAYDEGPNGSDPWGLLPEFPQEARWIWSEPSTWPVGEAYFRRTFQIPPSGVDWIPVQSGTPAEIRGLWGSSPSDIFGVGSSGAIIHYDGNTWVAMQSPTSVHLFSAWGTSGQNVFAVGDFATILHYDGVSWSLMENPGSTCCDNGAETTFRAVWGSSESNVYAVGRSLNIYRYDGTVWTASPHGAITDGIWDVWGSSANNVFAVGQAGNGITTILNNNGSSGWQYMPFAETVSLYSLWGVDEDDIFAVGVKHVSGNPGAILHFDGVSWTAMSNPGPEHLYGVWGTSANDVFAVGLRGVIHHYDGTGWAPMTSGTTQGLWDAWGGSFAEIFASGDHGTLLLHNRQPVPTESTTWGAIKTKFE